MGETGTGLSVIVPATDSPPTLGDAIAPIEAELGDDDELIVVERAEQPGPGDARNRGAAGAKGDVLVFIDADVVIEPGAIGRIRAAFDRDPGLGAMFGTYDDSPGDPAVVSQFRNLLHHATHVDGAGEASTFWAGLGAIRRDAFFSVDGYDAERYPTASVEDIDLGLRLTEAGVRIELDPTVRGKHLKRWTVRTMLETDLTRRGIPWISMLVERRARGAVAGESDLNLGWGNRFSALAAIAIAAGLLMRRGRLALLGVTVLLALNRRLYAVLHRRGGVGLLAVGFGLHVLHLLAAAASVPLGVARGLSRLRR